MKIQMLVYPDMTLLDLVGPLQVWSLWPGSEIQLVWKDTAPVMTDSGAAIVPTHTFAASERSPGILFAPGGAQGTARAVADPEITGFMAERGENSEWVTSVCTGALVLGAAKLLEGYQATTHWLALDVLPGFGAEPVRERWVIDRNRATGGGVTAGIDFGLALMAKVAGEDVARAVQLALEYAPKPPFDSGTPERADPETIALVRSWYAGAEGAGRAGEG